MHSSLCLALLLVLSEAFRAPPSSPVAIARPAQPYFCVLIPVDGRALQAFVEDKTTLAPDGQYLAQCPQRFVCVQTERHFCPHEENARVVAPWLINELPALVTTRKQLFQSTAVHVSCERSATVHLEDSTRLARTETAHTVETTDGTTIHVNNSGGAHIEATDGTHMTLHMDWSSETMFRDKTWIRISKDKAVDIRTADDTTLAFSENGLSLRLSDATTVLCSEYGMVVTTADGNETYIPVDSSGLEIQTEVSRIAVTEGLSADITTYAGTHVTLTPNATVVRSRSGGSVTVFLEGTVTMVGRSGLTIELLVENSLVATTADGSRLWMRQNDSLLVERESHAIVLFPNANALVVTKEEIISLSSDGSVVVVDGEGVERALQCDSEGVPCATTECSQ